MKLHSSLTCNSPHPQIGNPNTHQQVTGQTTCGTTRWQRLFNHRNKGTTPRANPQITTPRGTNDTKQDCTFQTLQCYSLSHPTWHCHSHCSPRNSRWEQAAHGVDVCTQKHGKLLLWLRSPPECPAGQRSLHRLTSPLAPLPQRPFDTPAASRHTEKWAQPPPPAPLPYLSAWLGRHFERGLERSPLLGCQDGSGTFGALMVLAILSGSFPRPVGRLAKAFFIITFA